MIEIWVVDGTEYRVSPEMKNQFLDDHKNAQFLGTVNQSAPQQTQRKKPNVSFFDSTWLGQGISRATSSGEAIDLIQQGGISGDFSNIDINVVQKYVDAQLESNLVQQYTPSHRMERFQKKYQKEGKTWTAFFRGVSDDPMIMAELFTQSLGTQIGTFMDSPDAKAATGVGFTTGATAGYKTGGGDGRAKMIKGGAWGLYGAMGSLATSMESALTFGELIQHELELEGLAFTDVNVKNLLEGPKGQSIRNKAVGRGMTIGAIETFSAGVAGSVVTKTLGRGPGFATKLRATGAGFAVEGIGGGTGEVAGRFVAGQEMDPAEIGFEAFTGLSSAPISVGYAMATYKTPTYTLNDEVVSHTEMKSFISTATDMEIATASINMENDITGLDAIAYEKQTNAIIESSIDEKVTDITDRQELIALEKQRQQLERSPKKGVNAPVGIAEEIKAVEEKIEAVINKYKGAVGIYKTKQGQSVLTAVADRVFQANLEFAKKHSSIYGLEVNDKMSIKEIAKKYGNEAASSDGFIKGNEIIINRAVAKNTGAVNVANHELLHGIIKKAMGDKVISADVISGLKSKFGKQWKIVEDKVYAKDKQGRRLYTNDYLAKNPDEWITMLSDAIQAGEIVFNDDIFTKVGDILAPVLRKFGFKKIGFKDSQSTYNFLKEYNKSIHKGALGTSITKATGTGDVVVGDTVFSKSTTDAVNELGRIDKDGNNLESSGTGNFYYQAEADDIVTEIKKKGYFNELIKAQYKADIVPRNFVSDVMTELTQHIRNYKPERKNESGLFGWINSQVRNKAAKVYNENYKQTEQEKTAKNVDDRTKEGEVKVQVAAETDTRMQALETEDLSPAAQAKKKLETTKKKKVLRSKFRKKLGIETGSKLYNNVLDAARKALLRAYGTGKSVRGIQIDLRNEAVLYLFKDIKNFLGNKEYIRHLKEFRVAIVEVILTADLVTMERNVADDQKVFTTFVRKLTKKEDVQAAVDQKQLPPDALNTIDKGQAVNLYEKRMPNEKEFVAFFDQPGINPKTGLKQGLKGTRKDQLAKYMAGALSFDATMEVANEPAVIQKRNDIAELNGVEVLKEDLQVLAATIDRDPDIKFHKSPLGKKLTYKQGVLKKTGKKNIVEIYAVVEVLDDIWYDNTKLQKYKNLTVEQAEKHGGKFIVDAAIDAYLSRGMERIDTQIVLDFIKKNKKKNQRVSQVYEQYFIDNAKKSIEKIKSKIKSNVVVREGGVQDVRFEFEGNTIGLEIKMDSARGVSVTWKFDDTYTVNNPIDIDAQTRLTDKIKKTAAESRFEGIDFTKGITKDQEANLRIHKSRFNHSEEVSAEFVTQQYADKSMPSNFINLGEAGVFYMLGNNDKTNAAVLEIANELGIEELTGKFQLYSRLNIGKPRKNGTRATTIRTEVQIDSKTFKPSNVNLTSVKDMDAFVAKLNNTLMRFSKSKNFETINDATKYSRSPDNPTKGISVLDFDDTLATTKSKVLFVAPDGTKGSLNAKEYANSYVELAEQGYEFDFSEFNKVVKGKPAPLLNKAKKLADKFGTKDMFILTARPTEAAPAIHAFLKANGLNIPLKNITGLNNSTAQAKATWIAEKVSDGYNDFYFADDAIQNVKAVDNMLNQFDVKRKVQQARIKFSKSMDKDFNSILEEVTGIDAKKLFSTTKARKRGAGKGKFRFFVPPSHEDFVGLLYNFMGKGKRGDAHKAFFDKALIKPLNRANNEIDVAKQAIANDYKQLNKQFPNVKDKLKKEVPNGDYTYEDAVRVYIWNKHKHKIPGLSVTDQKDLVNIVKNDTELKAYAENLNVISKQKKYVTPVDGWESGDIRLDLVDATGRAGRKQYFTEFLDNATKIFSEKNLNKIEAAYGPNFREALEDMLYRVNTGRNRPSGQNSIINRFNNYLAGSVGGVMFLNMRSAILQQLSTVNYINFADNNVFKAAAAFADQKQYWADWSTIFNSDMLKERRGGIQTDVNAAELAANLRNSKFGMRKLMAMLLKIGYTPTQIGDSIAIANGGSTFYRNRVNTYLKQGLSTKEAEKQAWTDFQEITQATQQSARPDMVSQQQASPIGKWILSFQNVTSQFNRFGKKAFLDIYNRRTTRPNTTLLQSDISNTSRVAYYFAIQNLLFYGLQTALFAVMFGGEEEDEKFLTKKERVINGSIDSILRGSGMLGGVVSTLKNMYIKFEEQRDKTYNHDEAAVIMEMFNVSPALGIKARKIVNAEKTLNYNKDVIKEMETFDLDNPAWSAYTNYFEAIFPFAPVNRMYKKTQNVRQSLDAQNTALQRIMLMLGWSQYNLGVEDTKIQEIKEEIKEEKQDKKKEEKKKTNKKKKFKNTFGPKKKKKKYKGF